MNSGLENMKAMFGELAEQEAKNKREKERGDLWKMVATMYYNATSTIEGEEIDFADRLYKFATEQEAQ